MANRPSIGLCLIVKNEEENLPIIYESVKGCFDEIYLTDTGSTDQTVALAEKFGMKVSHFEWIDDFAAARNFNFDQAKTDYTMWIDGDDVLSNPEEFKMWRDSALGLADMWLATYNYALNAEGKPVCSFARERVIKNGIGLRWKYFVHEGILPTTNRQIAAQYVTNWTVNHRRTEADLLKDRSRNLNLLKKNEKNLDARMRYYYGKELFENGQEFDAIKWLTEAAAETSMEMHDRILSIQYGCYAFLKVGQFNKAIDLATTGTQLCPQRAEFFTIIGDAYIKLNRPLDAAPFYRAALECKPMGMGKQAAAIFSTDDMYTIYPVNQLARIYANTGKMKEAIEICETGFEKYKNPETKQLLDETKRIEMLSVAYKNATPCSDIVITCPPQHPYKWDGKIYKEQAMGGSETAAIEMAQWMHKLSGRPVKIFNVRDTHDTIEGVEYISTNMVAEYMGKYKPYLHIAWRHNFKITDAPTFVWCHDLQTSGVEATDNYVKSMALTPFHKNYMHITQGVPLDKIWLTRNGVVPERFAGGPWAKDPWKFVFSSSPDRGLDRTMRVLDIVREKYPQIKLHIFYGRAHLDQYGLKAMRENLDKMVNDRKDWVIDHGKTEQVALMEHFKTAAYAVQPSDWIETSMISAVERWGCGIYQIMRAVGGCVDTLMPAVELGMASLINSNCITELEHKVYADEVIKAIEEERYKRVSLDANTLSWEGVAKQWLEELPKMAYT